MPIDIGPQMLDHLERKRAAGQISQGEYDARRAEIMELIRRGKAVHLTGFDRATQALFLVVGIGIGVWVMAASTNFLGVLLGMLIIFGGIVGARRAGRIRI